MSQNTAQGFGRIRSVLWPVHAFELKKLLPMLLMAFCVSFSYTVLRDTKDTLIVTKISSEAIPFLKFFGTLPAAIIFMLVFSKLSNVLKKETLFYVTFAPFILFFALFPIFFYPFREYLHPTAFAHYLLDVLPKGFHGLIGCLENWTFSLFYIGSELYGSVGLSMLFWGFANEITKSSEAKRFYTLLTMGFNVALLVSGPIIYFFSKYGKNLSANVDSWQITLNYLMGMVTIASLTIIASYWWMNRNILTDKRFYDPEGSEKKSKKSKTKLSIGESLAFLAKSKYIRSIALLVIGYGMCINLVEVVWKGQLKMQYPNYNDYSAFMGIFSTCTGLITIFMTFIGGYIIRTKGWGRAAAITPMALLITGTLFFLFVIFKGNLASQFSIATTTILLAAVLIGAFQNIVSKSSKYSLFDPTKEMAYIPLDQESKVKGKAAIDVVGARLGKSGGSFIYTVLLPTLGSLAAAGTSALEFVTPIVSVIVIGVIILWLGAVRSLNKQYTELTGEETEPAAAPTTEPTAAKA